MAADVNDLCTPKNVWLPNLYHTIFFSTKECVAQHYSVARVLNVICTTLHCMTFLCLICVGAAYTSVQAPVKYSVHLCQVHSLPAQNSSLQQFVQLCISLSVLRHLYLIQVVFAQCQAARVIHVDLAGLLQ